MPTVGIYVPSPVAFGNLMELILLKLEPGHEAVLGSIGWLWEAPAVDRPITRKN